MVMWRGNTTSKHTNQRHDLTVAQDMKRGHDNNEIRPRRLGNTPQVSCCWKVDSGLKVLLNRLSGISDHSRSRMPPGVVLFIWQSGFQRRNRELAFAEANQKRGIDMYEL